MRSSRSLGTGGPGCATGVTLCKKRCLREWASSTSGSLLYHWGPLIQASAAQFNLGRRNGGGDHLRRDLAKALALPGLPGLKEPATSKRPMTRPAAGMIGYGAADVVIANGGPLKNSL